MQDVFQSSVRIIFVLNALWIWECWGWRPFGRYPQRVLSYRFARYDNRDDVRKAVDRLLALKLSISAPQAEAANANLSWIFIRVSGCAIRHWRLLKMMQVRIITCEQKWCGSCYQLCALSRLDQNGCQYRRGKRHPVNLHHWQWQ